RRPTGSSTPAARPSTASGSAGCDAGRPRPAGLPARAVGAGGRRAGARARSAAGRGPSTAGAVPPRPVAAPTLHLDHVAGGLHRPAPEQLPGTALVGAEPAPARRRVLPDLRPA